MPSLRPVVVAYIPFTLDQRAGNVEVMVDQIRPCGDIRRINVLGEFFSCFPQRPPVTCETKLSVRQAFRNGQPPSLVQRWIQRKHASLVEHRQLVIGHAGEYGHSVANPAIRCDFINQNRAAMT